MARLNIESDLLTDNRFTDLMLKMGSVPMAIGVFVQACFIAQSHWLQGRKGIPRDVWLKQRLANELIDCGLATPYQDDDGERIRIAGSAEQFNWLIEARESGARGGRKSADLKLKDKKDRDPQGGVKGFQPSFLSSPSSLLSSPNSSLLSQRVPVSENPKPGSAVWEEYRFEYFERYGAHPDRNKEFNIAAKQLIEKIGAEDAPQVAAFYVRHNNRYYIERGHNLRFAVVDAQKLKTEWATGRQVTSAQAQQVDRLQTNVNAFAGLLAEAKKAGNNGKS